MKKTAFIFPGQGAQKIGMGQDFYEKCPASRQVFEEASALLGFSLPELCFTENERLDQTAYTQAALVTVEAAILAEIQERGLRQPDMTAGLSLGEYSALIAAGVITTGDALRVVRQRGILMQEAVPPGEGAMAAVTGLSAEAVEAVLADFTRKQSHTARSFVQIANDNCPGQLVISGYTEAVEAVCPLLKEAGARRTMRLNVSGPFHSRLLAEAGEKLAQVLAPVPVQEPKIPCFANINASPVPSADAVKDLLRRQVSHPVLWRQSVEQMIAAGADTFVEIGPGRTLCGFIRRINRSVRTLHIETTEDLNTLANIE